MKAILFLITFSLHVCNAVSQQAATSAPGHSTIVRGRLLVANMGFAPIPAFSFDSPIAIGSLSVKKKSFSYEPDFALGLNGKPWMANNWFRFMHDRNKTKIKASINPSLFFKNEQVDSTHEIVHAHRNFTFELFGTYLFSEKASLTFTYMQVHAFDHGTLSGNFFDISSSISAMEIPGFLKVNFKSQLFYFDFENNVNGLFVSGTLRSDFQKMPLSFYYQAVAPIRASFAGNGFKWNIGLIYNF